MAAREHRVSRRVLLGAACAFPLVRHPGLDPGPTFLSPLPPQGRWIPGQARNDEEKDGADEQSRAVTKWNRAVATLRRAETILKAAAPDLPALSLKIDLAVDHEIAELTGGDRCLASLKADARRLAGRKA